VVQFSAAASDLVDGAGVPVTCSSASGSAFPIGTTKVGCSATDKHGNTSASKSFDVIVKDTIAPALTLPANVAVDATGLNGAVVRFTATALDGVDGIVAVRCEPASGSSFPVGTTPVSCSAIDRAGNP